MDGLQKEQIKTLRADGYGYKKIAEILDISENTVKSFCRRNGLAAGKGSANIAVGLSDIPLDESERRCRECGKKIFNTSGHRQRKFCSPECRTAFWKKNQRLINRRSGVEMNCPVCGKAFTDYPRNKRKYCSHACYIAGRYKGGGGND